MARSKTPPKDLVQADLAPGVASHYSQVGNQVALLDQHIGTIAEELHYDGTLTVTALEDGIRFYQRCSVEALLEMGKRLLLLKHLTPHGEFKARVESLGFTLRTSQRYMQAAAKTSKSANLALLSTQVKSVSAFLELVTQDDDVLENLEEIDEIEAMSASELKAALRDAREQREADEKLLADKNKAIDKLKSAKKFKPDPKSIAKTEAEQAQLTELAEATLAAEVAFMRLANVVGNITTLTESTSVRGRATQSVQYMVHRLAEVIDLNEIDVSVGESIGQRPEWLKSLPDA